MRRWKRIWRTLASCAALAAGLALPTPAGAQEADDEIPVLLHQIETAVARSEHHAYLALLGEHADREAADDFLRRELPPGVTRAVVRERDRGALRGALPGEGYQLTLDVFEEMGARARETTWLVDVKRVGPAGRVWLIAGQRSLSAIEEIHRLSVDAATRYTTRALTIRDEDVEIALEDASVYVSRAGREVTALVALGAGTLRFRPEIGRAHV